MASSSASSVEEYLASLPPERRSVVGAVREVVVRNLPVGYRESMEYGMIAYAVPLERFPNTYNGQPLCYAGLAVQKNHYSLYLMCAYGSASEAAVLKEAFAAAGKRLDMGKSCVRFRSLDDLPLDAIGSFVARTPPEKYIAHYQSSRATMKSGAGKTTAKKSAKSARRKKATKKRAR
jgi:uncharacterized protein DUF1801